MKRVCVSKMGAAAKCLTETIEVVGDIKRPHTEHKDSSTHESVFTGQLQLQTIHELELYSL